MRTQSAGLKIQKVGQTATNVSSIGSFKWTCSLQLLVCATLRSLRSRTSIKTTSSTISTPMRSLRYNRRSLLTKKLPRKISIGKVSSKESKIGWWVSARPSWTRKKTSVSSLTSLASTRRQLPRTLSGLLSQKWSASTWIGIATRCHIWIRSGFVPRSLRNSRSKRCSR